eukprot:m.5190 g.5190  ORF g.5190 m.5190 type:complete len:137 (+) comp7483_c0_seq1:91-501(+)
MPRFLKEKKVVILLSGRYAGRKAVIVTPFDEGSTVKPFGHCLVAGIDQYPRKITKRMSEKKIAKRSTIKPFVKVVNYNHVMPTRYSVDVALDKSLVSKAALKDGVAKAKARKEVKSKFLARYKKGTDKWFFQKLRF